MSVGALLRATRNHLRNQLGLKDEECMVMPDGRPIPSCGQRFISLYPTYWGPKEGDNNQALYEQYDIACVITFRTPLLPFDRIGENLIYEDSPFPIVYHTMEEWCRLVMVAVHMNTSIMGEANKELATQGVAEYLRWAGNDPTPSFVDGSWFFAATEELAGLTQTVRFEGATRFQPLSVTVT